MAEEWVCDKSLHPTQQIIALSRMVIVINILSFYIHIHVYIYISQLFLVWILNMIFFSVKNVNFVQIDPFNQLRNTMGFFCSFHKKGRIGEVMVELTLSKKLYIIQFHTIYARVLDVVLYM